MFRDTWEWAGKLRQREAYIGVDPRQITIRLQQLLANTEAQLHQSPNDVDVVVARFHHDLVFIHPFPNGNGRHARMLSDLVLVNRNRPEFTWGSASLDTVGPARERYLAALRAADAGDFGLLEAFVRS